MKHVPARPQTQNNFNNVIGCHLKCCCLANVYHRKSTERHKLLRFFRLRCQNYYSNTRERKKYVGAVLLLSLLKFQSAMTYITFDLVGLDWIWVELRLKIAQSFHFQILIYFSFPPFLRLLALVVLLSVAHNSNVQKKNHHLININMAYEWDWRKWKERESNGIDSGKIKCNFPKYNRKISESHYDENDGTETIWLREK